MEFFDVVTTTRAIRRYRRDPIAEEDLAAIMFAATRAPSGSNRQPFRFVVLRDGERAARARVVLREGFQSMWSAMRSREGFDQGSGADPSSRKARMAATMQHFVDNIDRAPAIVLACATRRAHHGDGASIYPACQNLLLSARALGYGGVMTTWHQLVEEELRGILEIPEDAAIAATIPLGRPAGHHGPVRRLPLTDLVYEDAWEAPAAWAVDPEGTRFTGGPPEPRQPG